MSLRDDTGPPGPTRAVRYLTGAVLVGACLSGAPGRSPGQADGGAAPRPSAASVELRRMFDEDQADRAEAAIDGPVLISRDRKRRARVKAMIEQGELHAGADSYHAAMILQHGQEPDDFLPAHELCVVAISKGDDRGRWLAAASEDRFLMNIGRPQRFGTQVRGGGPDGPVRLYRVDPAVTDGLRRAMDCPTLAEARQREARIPPAGPGKP